MAQLYALVIGINYTQSQINPLHFAESDAAAMADVLEEAGYSVVTLLGEAATRAAIIQALVSQSTHAGSDGLLLFYFAGRGEVDPYDSDTAYLVPADADPNNLVATAISLDNLVSLYPRYPHLMVTLLDCVHSGYAIGLR
jgi:uncharacterized caspase-like protein